MSVCVHACVYLTVSDAGVPVSVGRQDSSQRSDAHLILKGVMLRHGAVEVSLDLLCR